MIPKEKLERLVIRQLQTRVLTRENLELLVKMVNEELQTAASGLRDRLEMIDTEIRDVRARLTKLYEALETGKVEADKSWVEKMEVIWAEELPDVEKIRRKLHKETRY